MTEHGSQLSIHGSMVEIGKEKRWRWLSFPPLPQLLEPFDPSAFKTDAERAQGKIAYDLKSEQIEQAR